MIALLSSSLNLSKFDPFVSHKNLSLLTDQVFKDRLKKSKINRLENLKHDHVAITINLLFRTVVS
jgi:hypothetical protein